MTESVKPHSTHKNALHALEIRDMTIADLAAVYAMGEDLFTAERWQSLYRTWDQYALATHFAADSETCLVAELDDRVVGFAVGTLLEKPGTAWTYGYLVWLGVQPGHARLGVGAKLVAELQDRFIELGARMILVDTDTDNRPAIAFFGTQGYQPDTQHVYLSKDLTYDPDYIDFHRQGRIADRPGGLDGARKRAARLKKRAHRHG